MTSGGDNPYNIHDAKLSRSATTHESSSVTAHEISNITGLRDSLGFSLFQKSVEEKHPGENYSVKDIMKMFFRDPDECF